MIEWAHFRLRWVGVALLFYVALLLFLFYYFAYYQTQKHLRFVEKNDAIEVSLAPAKGVAKAPKRRSIRKQPDKTQSKAKPAKTKAKLRPVPKKEPKKTLQTKEKRSKTQKLREKTVRKEKVKRKGTAKKAKAPKPKPKQAKKKSTKTKKAKKQSLSSLFGEIKVSDKPKRSAHRKTRQAKSGKKGKRPQSRGIENAYLAKVQKQLYEWPAQSEFAGKKATVFLRIYPSGRFEFRLTKPSGDSNFNQALIDYLKSLQTLGFDPHPGTNAYEIDVDFEATE